MKKINNFIKKFTRKEKIIPLATFFIWILLTLFYIFNYNLSLSVISYSHSKNNFEEFSTNRLYKDHSVFGEFVAKENYLGIVTIRFTTFSQVAYTDEDTLIFRIKEKGTRNWFYQNTYRSGSIFHLPFYPFGFPKIENSRGKTYVFEIKSLNGNRKNSIALSSWEPVLVTRYQIPKSLLLQNKTNLIKFLERKIVIAFGNQEVIFFSFIYFLPFLFYLILFNSPLKKIFLPIFAKFEKKLIDFFEQTIVLKQILYLIRLLRRIFKMHLDKILLTIVLINIFLIPALNDVALVVISLLWLYVARLYKKTSKISFVVGISLLILSSIALFFNLENNAEKSSVWAYMFFLTGTLQILFERNRLQS